MQIGDDSRHATGHGEHPSILNRLGDKTRLIVSEPLRDLESAWHEVPESSAGVIQPGRDEV